MTTSKMISRFPAGIARWLQGCLLTREKGRNRVRRGRAKVQVYVKLYIDAFESFRRRRGRDHRMWDLGSEERLHLQCRAQVPLAETPQTFQDSVKGLPLCQLESEQRKMQIQCDCSRIIQSTQKVETNQMSIIGWPDKHNMV